MRLDGSIELAPLVGLAERIVDLVQSGETLRANGLVEVAEIARSTARLIVNRAAMKTEYAAITELIDEMRNGATPHLEQATHVPSRPRGPRSHEDARRARARAWMRVVRAVDRPPSRRCAPRSRSARSTRSSPTSARAATPRCSSIRRASTASAPPGRRARHAPADFEAAERDARAGGAGRAGVRGRAHRALPRRRAAEVVADHRRARLGARPGRAAARARRHLHPRRPGRLSLDRADDGGARAGGRGPGDRARHAAGPPTAGCLRPCWPPRGSPASPRAGGSAARRRSRRWPTAPPTIRRVDKIVGPGNVYVALAKAQGLRRRRDRHGGRARARSSSSPTAHADPALDRRPICSPRPSTTRWPARC